MRRWWLLSFALLLGGLLGGPAWAAQDEQAAKLDGLTKDLAAKEEALTAAKAETAKAVQETQAAQEAAAKQKADLEGTIEGLKTQMAEETSRLQAELDAAKQAAQEAAAAQAAPASAKPSAQTMAARPASTASTTLVWYSPAAKSNIQVARKPSAWCISAAPASSQRSLKPQKPNPRARSITSAPVSSHGCGCVDRSVSA